MLRVALSLMLILTINLSGGLMADDEVQAPTSWTTTILSTFRPEISDGDEEDDDRLRLRIKIKKKKVDVVPSATTEYIEHRAVKLGEVADGVALAVLGRYQPSMSTEGGGSISERIIQIQVLVAGDGFEVPPLTKKQKEIRLEWRTGHLTKEHRQYYYISGVVLHFGIDRLLLQLRKGGEEMLAKKRRIRIEGSLKTDTDPQQLEASRITVFAKKFKRKEYLLAYPERK